jgi:hypothetical protein
VNSASVPLLAREGKARKCRFFINLAGKGEFVFDIMDAIFIYMPVLCTSNAFLAFRAIDISALRAS